MSKIKHGFQGDKPGTELNIHIGPVDSGAAVVADNTLISKIKQDNGKLIGIEMESYAVYFAAMHCIGTAPKVISIKSIVDFADEFKGDTYRKFAAYTSVQCLYEFCFIYLYSDMTNNKL
jgi:nucleoside phosphorylase